MTTINLSGYDAWILYSILMSYGDGGPVADSERQVIDKVCKYIENPTESSGITELKNKIKELESELEITKIQLTKYNI